MVSAIALAPARMFSESGAKVVCNPRYALSSPCGDIEVDVHGCWSCARFAYFDEGSTVIPDPPWRLQSADDLEVLIDEDVVRPVDANDVDVIFAVA